MVVTWPVVVNNALNIIQVVLLAFIAGLHVRGNGYAKDGANKRE